MGWKDKQTDETAANLKTRLESAGFRVDISEETGSTIVYHNGSSPLKQTVTAKTYEYRGLTKDAAKLLVDLTNDATTTTVYYSQRASSTSGSAQYCAAAVRSGTITTVVALRHNEGDEWVARVSETTYSGGGTGWTTTRPTASQTGVVVANHKRSVRNAYGEGVGYKLQTITTTVTEYQFCTQAEAATLCTSSDTTTVHSLTYSDTSGNSHCFYYTAGTVTTSTMRYIDETNGWTVTKTTEVTTV